MVTQEKTAEFSGETVRNVAGTLTWCAQPHEQSEVLTGNWLADLLANRNRAKLQGAMTLLAESFRKRHNAIGNVFSVFQERLQRAVEEYPAGREMDPDDIAVPALEQGEEYFRKEREGLREIREALQRNGGGDAFGAEVLEELERLDRLFKGLVESFQELRWAIMIHDGELAPSPEGTCTSGAGFMASLENR